MLPACLTDLVAALPKCEDSEKNDTEEHRKPNGSPWPRGREGNHHPENDQDYDENRFVHLDPFRLALFTALALGFLLTMVGTRVVELLFDSIEKSLCHNTPL